LAVTLQQLFQDEAYTSILQRLLDRIPSDIDKAEGSYIWDAEAPVAYEYAKQAAFFKFVVEQAFALLASGEYLDKMAADFGISRAPAVPATVTLLFTGNPGGEIPAGTRAAVQGTSIIFATDEDAVISIGGTVSVAATCITAGEAGNIPNGVVTLMVDYVAPVATVDNPAPATGGVDAESDDTLRSRILFFKRNPERGGTATDYQRWAFTVAGVVSAHCVNLARGIGSVDVILGAPPDIIDSLVVLVQAVVDLKKPLGVHPLVKSATILPVDFRITVSGIDALEAEDIATTYLNTVGIGGKAVFAKLTAAIIAAGADDAYITEPAGTELILPSDTMLDPSVYITVVV
jgi:uncharacterized phage protein gp47/JayE